MPRCDDFQLCFDEIHQKREFIFHLNTQDSGKTINTFGSLDKCHVKMERYQNASKSKCFDTRFYRRSWAHPQPKCGTSQMMMKYNTDMHLVLWGVYKPCPQVQFCRWSGPWGILLSSDWCEVSLFKGTHPIKGPLRVICCKRRQQGSWNSIIHFHWSAHSVTFLSNLSVFWMKDFNFLKARPGFAPLLLFLYDSYVFGMFFFLIGRRSFFRTYKYFVK